MKYINVYADNFIHVNKNKVLTNEEVEIGVRVDTCYNCSPNTYYRYYFGDSTKKISTYSVKHSYAKPGIYDVSVVYSLSCKNKYIVDSIYSKALIIVGQGTEVESETENHFSITPNPASDYIEISCPHSEKMGLGAVSPAGGGQGVDISIFDILGIEFTTPSLRDTPPWQGGEKVRMDVSALAPGVYFVRVGVTVWKFVKI